MSSTDIKRLSDFLNIKQDLLRYLGRELFFLLLAPSILNSHPPQLKPPPPSPINFLFFISHHLYLSILFSNFPALRSIVPLCFRVPVVPPSGILSAKDLDEGHPVRENMQCFSLLDSLTQPNFF